jgi:ferredoxin
MEEIVKRIREEARRLLEEKEVEWVLGYRESYRSGVYTPHFASSPEEADLLTFNENCRHNLARYLVGREGLLSRYNPEKKTKVALVAGPATMRTVVGLIQERQFKRDDVVILGIVDKDEELGIEPDVTIGELEGLDQERQRLHEELREFEQLDLEERRKFWLKQAEKCIRCYACREICPFCYCEECIADKNKPQWIYRSPRPVNNLIWLAIRAFHLAGRCAECGECERACPVDIPLMLLNIKLVEIIKERFGYEAGRDLEAKPPLSDFRLDDKAEFIK